MRGKLSKQQSLPQHKTESPVKLRRQESELDHRPEQKSTANTNSPSKSPTKRGTKSKARDVLQLPKPYNAIKSDTVKRWNSHWEKGSSLENDEKDFQLFQMVEFTHALVLKVNQLSKQVIFSLLKA